MFLATYEFESQIPCFNDKCNCGKWKNDGTDYCYQCWFWLAHSYFESNSPYP